MISIKTRVVVKEKYSGAMIAFLVPEGFRANLEASKDSFAPGSKFVPRAEYHVTLAHADEISEVGLEQVKEIVKSVAESTTPFWVYIGGTGRFDKVEGGKYDAVYAIVKSAGLQHVHKKLNAALKHVNDNWEWEHNGFTPHVTLAYVPPGSKHSAEVTETEILAYRIAVVSNGTTVEYMLKGN